MDDLDGLQAALLLWAHAQLGHGSPTLLHSLYRRLATASVGPDGGGSDDNGNGRNGSSQGQQGQLQIQGMDAAVMLAYAMAKLERPAPALLDRLVGAMLADSGSGAASSKDAGGRHTSSSGGGGGGRVGAGIALGACSSRDLCLLLWSLSTLRSCPPSLLLRATRLLRQRGLGDLSVQSMGHIMLAQDLAGQQWDQALVDDVAAELAWRWRQHQEDQRLWQQLREQHLQQQQPAGQERQQQQLAAQQPQLLNELDCSILARCFALAWQRALAESAGTDAQPPGAHAHATAVIAGWCLHGRLPDACMHALQSSPTTAAH